MIARVPAIAINENNVSPLLPARSTKHMLMAVKVNPKNEMIAVIQIAIVVSVKPAITTIVPE